MRLHLGPVGDDEGHELSIAHALLRQASAGEIDEALRIYQAPGPVVVFGRRDTRLPGFDAANASALRAGFHTFVRATGGRAVAYTDRAIVVDHVKRAPNPSFSTDQRFREYGALLAGSLRQLGVDARVGAVPGEYCPGAYSVNARGVVKLIGTAQRSVRDAWLFSSLIIVDDGPRLRLVLKEVYSHLELPFDSSSVGSIADEQAGVAPGDVGRAVLGAYAVDPSAAIAIPDSVRALASSLRDQHLI